MHKLARPSKIKSWKTMQGVYKQKFPKSYFPSIATTSMKILLELFGDKIIEMKGVGQVQISKTELPSFYGFFAKTKVQNWIEVNYIRNDYAPKGIEGCRRLGTRARNEILQRMDKMALEDIPIDKLKVEIQDSMISKLIRKFGFPKGRLSKKEETFVISLSGIRCYSDLDRAEVRGKKDNPEHWKSREYNRQLIEDCGFQYRTLDVDQMVNLKQINDFPRNLRAPLIDWDWFISPEPIARRVKSKFDEWGMMKRFKMGKKKVRELIEIR